MRYLVGMEGNTFPQPVDTPAIPVRVLAELVCGKYPNVQDVVRNLPEEVVRIVNMIMGRAYELGFRAAVFSARAEDQEVGESIPLEDFVNTWFGIVSDVPKWAYDEGFEWSEPDFEDTPEWWAENVWDRV